MLEVLEKWNRWGSNKLESGIVRQMLGEILPFMHSNEVIVLKGPRRSGKSTILYQIMDALEKEGVPQESMLHVNFEEPKLSPRLGNVSVLDDLYDNFREHLCPTGKAYVFLDEIQNVPNWEKWVRARNKTEDIKIFLTGSSAQLMSREIATLLTGRHLSFEVMPLSFSEYLRFSKIPSPKHRRPVTPPALIRRALNEYQNWGGFPAVTLGKTEQYKNALLSEYFDDILYKDIVIRNNVRDLMLLRNIAIHLLTQTGKCVSFQRVANTFQVSNDSAVNYCRYIQESYMVELLPYYSLRATVRQRHPHKVYATDLGLRNAVALANTADEGRLVETLVYHKLREKFGNNVFYWSKKGELDFIIREGNTITQLWQVVADGVDDEKVMAREMKAFHEAKESFPNAEMFLVAKTLPKEQQNYPFQVIPLWLLLTE